MASPETPPHQAASMQAAYDHVQAASDALKQQMADWSNLEDRIRENLARVPTFVALNVGGITFQAFKDTLLRVEGSYFHTLLGSGVWKPDSPGDAYFLDLDPDIFRHVLKFLRTGALSTDRLTQSERGELKSMMEYLKLDEVPTALQWDPAMHAPEIALSPDLRTLERLQAHDGAYKGAVAKLPLVGSLSLRVDCIQKHFFIGLGAKTKCDVTSTSTRRKCYHLLSTGSLFNKKTKKVDPRLPSLKDGDVVTLCRTVSTVEFTINDGPTYPIELVDASEALYPMVFMSGSGTKMSILDPSETWLDGR